MILYLDLVILLNFCVDFLLLTGTNTLAGHHYGFLRCAAGALLGGLYAGACMLPQFHFLGNTLWRIVFLGFMAVIAFGWNKSILRRAVLFVFLSMALGGIAGALEKKSFFALIFSAGAVMLMCRIGFRGQVGKGEYIPVELTYQGKTCKIMALCDTGNTLSDPITGRQVLIAGPEIACELLGFTEAELADPIVTMERSSILGLRLIPYRAVGKSSGMLLALRFDKVLINGKRAEDLVAFAPNSFGKNGEFQALTGGV